MDPHLYKSLENIIITLLQDGKVNTAAEFWHKIKDQIHNTDNTPKRGPDIIVDQPSLQEPQQQPKTKHPNQYTCKNNLYKTSCSDLYTIEYLVPSRTTFMRTAISHKDLRGIHCKFKDLKSSKYFLLEATMDAFLKNATTINRWFSKISRKQEVYTQTAKRLLNRLDILDDKYYELDGDVTIEINDPKVIEDLTTVISRKSDSVDMEKRIINNDFCHPAARFANPNKAICFGCFATRDIQPSSVIGLYSRCGMVSAIEDESTLFDPIFLKTAIYRVGCDIKDPTKPGNTIMLQIDGNPLYSDAVFINDARPFCDGKSKCDQRPCTCIFYKKRQVNAEISVVFKRNAKQTYAYTIIKTTSKIQKGEEILVSYGPNYWNEILKTQDRTRAAMNSIRASL